jgi:hypothetical protein
MMIVKRWKSDGGGGDDDAHSCLRQSLSLRASPCLRQVLAFVALQAEIRFAKSSHAKMCSAEECQKR